MLKKIGIGLAAALALFALFVATRPAEFRGLKVPDVLISGDHGKVRAWRREQALQRTRERRPDLLDLDGKRP